MDTGIEAAPRGAKRAPTFAVSERLTRQTSDRPLHPPLQPVNLLPADAPARSLTFVPGSKLPKHFDPFPPHEMPVPVTAPAPDTATVRRFFTDGTKVAVFVATGSVAITGSTAGAADPAPACPSAGVASARVPVPLGGGVGFVGLFFVEVGVGVDVGVGVGVGVGAGGITLKPALTLPPPITPQAPLPEQAPPQPSNESPEPFFVAVRVTVTPSRNVAVHALVQPLIPAGELDTLPGPDTVTLTVTRVTTGGSGEQRQLIG
jgi:hypothetical protein